VEGEKRGVGGGEEGDRTWVQSYLLARPTALMGLSRSKVGVAKYEG